jgi:hypothetical protein
MRVGRFGSAVPRQGDKYELPIASANAKIISAWRRRGLGRAFAHFRDNVPQKSVLVRVPEELDAKPPAF